MEKSIIIIGAGIAGLAAGCYAQMNGYRSQIFELHDIPGGLCTAWERRGYTFDGCIHYLFGSGAGQPFHFIWEELGAVQDRPMANHDEFMRVVSPDGLTFIAYSDPDRLEEHMLELSPRDARRIHEFANGVRRFTKFDMSLMLAKPRALMNQWDWLNLGRKMMPFLVPLLKYGTVSAHQFAAQFQDPFLRQALARIFAWPEIPIMAAMQLLAYMHNDNAGFPIGGSLAFARAIERRYLALGGQIHYKAQVEQILVENDRAVGVRLYNDEEHRADHILSAADGRGTIFHMLDGRYTSRAIRALYDGHLPVHSTMQISYGVKRDMHDVPHWVTYLLEKPVLIAGAERQDIGVQHYSYDSTLAPAGRSSMVVLLKSDYDYWQRIYGRRLYDTEQMQVAEQLLELIERWHPGLQEDIEVTDVATPVSHERYTGNWLGSTCGWLLTTETLRHMIFGVPKTLPGLGNLYMAGQWVEPGGSVPLAAASGRNAIQLICEADQREFRVEKV